jgi:hypothetical protein
LVRSYPKIKTLTTKKKKILECIQIPLRLLAEKCSVAKKWDGARMPAGQTAASWLCRGAASIRHEDHPRLDQAFGVAWQLTRLALLLLDAKGATSIPGGSERETMNQDGFERYAASEARLQDP